MSASGLRTHTSSNSPGAGRRTPGVYTGIVTDNDDPRKMGRVRFKVPEIGGQKIFAWAKPPMAVGGNKAGVFSALTPDAPILVTFEANDVNRPVILGAWYPQVSEKSTIPDAAQGTADEIRSARGTDTGTGAGGAALKEPVDPFGADYPFNFVFKSPGSGHLIEVDDTAGKERISITHAPSKSWFEFHPDGSIVMGAQGKRYVVVEQANQEHFKTTHDVLVDGSMSHKTTGAHTEEFGGNAVATYQGNRTTTVEGNDTKSVTGTTTETLTGAVTKTLQSSLGLTITGVTTISLLAALTLSGLAMALSVASLTIVAGSIILGSSSGGLALMNENALALLNTNIGINNGHIHITTLPGVPTGPPTVPQIPLPNTPGIDKTSITKAV